MIAKDWNRHGFRCIVRLIETEEGMPRHYCGYVVIPDGHPVYGKWHDWKYLDYHGIAVHGGITFQGKPNWSDWTEKVWAIGFDCAHAGDCFLYDEPRMTPWGEMEHKWTLEEATQETEKLASQLMEM